MKTILGQRLKELREEKGLTQEKVAADLGITQPNYSRYEKETREPSISLLADMAKYFDVTIDYLVGLTDNY